MISGELIKEVSQFKYLGIEIHNQLSSKPHLNAREELFYTRLSELNHVGMDNIKTSSKYRAMLYKTYARPVLMYGMDLVNMNIGQLKHLQTTEANALKIATDISTRCRTTNLLKAYTVTTTKDLIITKKCSLFIRLLANSYTRTIIESIIAESHNHFITDSFLNEIVMITQTNSMNLNEVRLKCVEVKFTFTHFSIYLVNRKLKCKSIEDFVSTSAAQVRELINEYDKNKLEVLLNGF